MLRSLAASVKLLVTAWGASCALLLGPPARAAWTAGKAVAELLLPVWKVTTSICVTAPPKKVLSPGQQAGTLPYQSM